MSKHLRTDATQSAYDQAMIHGETNLHFDKEGLPVFDLDKETILKEYKHWVIIAALYPYDAIFTTHHLLVPRRTFPFLRDATDEEEAQYYAIKQELDAVGEYESIIENFSNSRSVRKHFHAHLVVWLDQDE